MQSVDEFTVAVNGNDGEVLRGKFKIKVKLSVKDRLRIDEIRRGILGGKSSEADGEADSLARALGKIQVHIIESPQFWKDHENGLAFEDLDPVLKVLEQITKIEATYYEAKAKEAEAAKEELKNDLLK